MSHHVLNALGHFDIAGPELAPLGRFYTGVFGWSVDPKGLGYALLQTPDGGANGALIESESAALTIGIIVPDLGAALAAADRHGGHVVMPVADNGWVKKVVIADPAGNQLTVIQA
jgi:predicted enzyme related to lactoylglutathione lyase